MLYNKEIKRAIDWFLRTQNSENFGWSWVRDISPNIQNTAEVIYSTSLFIDLLDDTQKEFINEAAEYWLMFPLMNCAITIDWIWTGMGLTEYKKNWDKYCANSYKKSELDAFRKHSIQKIDNAISLCVENLINLQNKDGGWADNKGDVSTVIRTAAVIVFLNRVECTSAVEKAIHRGVDWLLKMQNADGGWGNVNPNELKLDTNEYTTDITVDVIDEQFESNSSATGYAMLALSGVDRIKYRPVLKKAATILNGMVAPTGDFGIFYEVGLRRDTIFTYRHFGTVWAALGLLASGDINAISDNMVNSIKYILSLQSPISGGFKCTENSGVYTWSTVNALMFLKEISESLTNLSGVDYTDMIIYYINNKNKQV